MPKFRSSSLFFFITQINNNNNIVISYKFPLEIVQASHVAALS